MADTAVRHHGGGIWSKIRKRDGKRVYYVRVYWKGKTYSEKAGSTLRQVPQVSLDQSLVSIAVDIVRIFTHH